jgi:diguanylate cyclase (GGDEF)-like protein
VDVAKQLVQVIDGMSIPHVRSGVSSTVSISQGIASVVPTQDTRPESVIELADQALYQAKQQGRNRYIVSTGK